MLASNSEHDERRNNSTLSGVQVLVTRPEHQADNLCRLIEQCCGIPVRFPTIQIVATDQGSSAINKLPKLSDYQWLIFTSANAVNFALRAKGGTINCFNIGQIAAIGKATAKALESAGLHASLIPMQSYNSEGLLVLPPMQSVDGQNFLIVRGQGGREELANTLRKRGAKVAYWEVYKRIIPKADNTVVVNLLADAKLDVIVATSFEALHNLTVMLGAVYFKKLAIIPLVVVSQRIRLLALDLGFKEVTVAEEVSDLAILESIKKIINESK